MAFNDDRSILHQLIEPAVQAALSPIVEAEIDACLMRIRKAVGERMDAIALKVLSHYDIERQANRLIITVRKPEL